MQPSQFIQEAEVQVEALDRLMLGHSGRWRSEQIRSAMRGRPAVDQKSGCMAAYENAELTLSTQIGHSGFQADRPLM